MIINILYLLLFAGVQCCFGFLVQRAEFGPLNQSAPIEEIHHDTPQTYIFEDDAVLKILEKPQTSKVIREYEDATSNFLSTDKSHSINDIASNNVFAEKPSQIILVDKLKDKIERVTNEIEKDIVTLTMNDVQRSKRSAFTTTSSLVPTLSHYSSKLAELKNTISMMIESIEQVKKSLTNEDKQRFSTVEKHVINLNIFIDNQSRETDDEMDKVKNTNDRLSNTRFVALNQKLAEQELKMTECIEAVLDEMQNYGEFSTHAIFKIAYRIKSSIGSDNPNLSRLKNRLPESVRNAVFATKVCIKNVFLNKYLYRGDSYDDDRGNVYTGISAKVREADWLIEPDGEQFSIKNDYHSEYLYSARPYGRTFNSDRGLVFTWIPGNKDFDTTWKIEPNGDNCFIKNVLRKEYLCSSRKLGQSYDEESGSVYTWIPGNKTPLTEWKIEDCS